MFYIYNKKGEYINAVYDLTEEDIKTLMAEHFINTIKYEKPVVKDGELVETVNSKITIGYEKDTGRIIGYELGESAENIYENQILIDYDDNFIQNNKFYKLVDGSVLYFDKEQHQKFIEGKEHEELEEKRKRLIEDTKKLEEYEKQKAFEFKGYIQPNRELEDQTSLLKILSFMQITGAKTFDKWKMKDKEGHEHYVSLTIQEMMQLGQLMQTQTTTAMVKWSNIREEIKAMGEEELKKYQLEKIKA